MKDRDHGLLDAEGFPILRFAESSHNLAHRVTIHVLALVREQGLDFPLEDTSFFLDRERIIPGRRSLMPMWRSRLFAFMSRNAVGATTYFRVPPERVVEVDSQIEI